MRSLELFTGAGGLALGTAMAGFDHEALIERDHDSCETVRLNQRRRVRFVKNWSVIEGDATNVDYRQFSGVELLAGGVPCQPFSLGGKHRGQADNRDMFPEFVRAVATIRPKAFLIENVKGLLRSAFADYFEYTILRLSHPAIRPGKRTWREHRAELESIHTAGCKTDVDYNIVFQLLNAADYGVPQRRERVFIVGFRSDLGIQWSFPNRTHSVESLLRDQWLTGRYWDRHEVSVRSRPRIDARTESRLSRTVVSPAARLCPCRTVRDAISTLPRLRVGQTSSSDPNHFINPGARSYDGHTGSLIDEPAKTLKAGDHGVPGGENTLSFGRGRVRYFSVREAARLQTFPDDYWFAGAWTERMRQLGNAVPVELARIVAASMFNAIILADTGRPNG